MSNLSTWVEVSKSALLHNLQEFQKITLKKAKICPILKSNAYGHDMVKTAKTLQNEQIWGFGTVNLEEAIELRKHGIKKPILVLSYCNNDIRKAIKEKIQLPVYHLKFAQVLDKLAKNFGQKVKIHLKIDVGTSRLGILPHQINRFILGLKKLKNTKLEGVFSHLADSENSNWHFTNTQLKSFNASLKLFEKNKINIPLKHIACSAAALGSEKTHYNLIRPGISLYGLWPSQAVFKKTKKRFPKLKLKPVLSWYTKIIQIKEIPRNTNIGYGQTFKTKRLTKIAVLPVGYWEGYDRLLSNKGEVIVRSKKCPVLGRVCMNMMMVNITRIKNARVGDRVILLGQDKKEKITTEDLAQKTNTINYEVVTRINPLIPRIYI